MSEYYVSQTRITAENGRIRGIEVVLTKPASKRATRRMVQRMNAIGIENLHLCPPNLKRYRRRVREQNKRRIAARDLTVAEVAEIFSETQA